MCCARLESRPDPSEPDSGWAPQRTGSSIQFRTESYLAEFIYSSVNTLIPSIWSFVEYHVKFRVTARDNHFFLNYH